MLTVKKKFKSPKSRKLYVYDGKKIVDILSPWWGWYCHSTRPTQELSDEIRKLTMENLYWLLGKDTDKDGWEELVEYWDHGNHVFGVPVDKLPKSMFHSSEEKELALKSFES